MRYMRYRIFYHFPHENRIISTFPHYFAYFINYRIILHNFSIPAYISHNMSTKTSHNSLLLRIISLLRFVQKCCISSSLGIHLLRFVQKWCISSNLGIYLLRFVQKCCTSSRTVEMDLDHTTSLSHVDFTLRVRHWLYLIVNGPFFETPYYSTCQKYC